MVKMNKRTGLPSLGNAGGAPLMPRSAADDETPPSAPRCTRSSLVEVPEENQ